MLRTAWRGRRRRRRAGSRRQRRPGLHRQRPSSRQREGEIVACGGGGVWGGGHVFRGGRVEKGKNPLTAGDMGRSWPRVAHLARRRLGVGHGDRERPTLFGIAESLAFVLNNFCEPSFISLQCQCQWRHWSGECALLELHTVTSLFG